VLPNVALGADTTFCEDYPIELNAWNEGASYLWSTGDTTASILTSGSGLYRVEATNVCGMSADEIRISNFPCSWALYIPSGCTPNEDTFNEGWGVSGYNLKEIDLTIYNRFGDAIFHSTELDALWLPSAGAGDDTYNYRIEVTPFEGSKEVRTGVIYLLR
jgi:gliding motility-associated-like protein